MGVWWDRDKERWRNEKGRAVRLPPLSVARLVQTCPVRVSTIPAARAAAAADLEAKLRAEHARARASNRVHMHAPF